MEPSDEKIIFKKFEIFFQNFELILKIFVILKKIQKFFGIFFIQEAPFL